MCIVDKGDFFPLSTFYASATKHLGIGISVGLLVGWSVGFDTTFKKVLCASLKHIPACRSVFSSNILYGSYGSRGATDMAFQFFSK